MQMQIRKSIKKSTKAKLCKPLQIKSVISAAARRRKILLQRSHSCRGNCSNPYACLENLSLHSCSHGETDNKNNDDDDDDDDELSWAYLWHIKPLFSCVHRLRAVRQSVHWLPAFPVRTQSYTKRIFYYSITPLSILLFNSINATIMES